MLININISTSWRIEGSLHIKGHLLMNRKLSEQFSCHIKSMDFDHVKSCINEASGDFAIVYFDGNTLCAATDRVRSVPLFYGERRGNFYLSDNPYWLSEQLGAQQFNKEAEFEFLLAGYVTGRDTLHPFINQLQAGEVLFISEGTRIPKPIIERYFKYLHNSVQFSTERELINTWDDILIATFNKLIEVANGRQLVLPLSGGFDSRLIAMMLYRLRYDNVICFSYGQPWNKESNISQSVAEQLGFRWHFTKYSQSLWYWWYRSEQFKKYVRYADGICSVAHIQDWPAVWDMNSREILSADSIFVPGHSADFLAGSHIPLNFMNSRNINRTSVVETILKHHFSLWKHDTVLYDMLKELRVEDLYSKIVQKINTFIGDFPIETRDQAIDAIECFDWQERQSKFIVNSVRAYEFWGYSYYLPFWDRDVMGFWSSVPIKYRIRKKIYDKYIELLGSQLGLNIKNENASPNIFPEFQYYMNRIQILQRISDQLREKRRKKILKDVYEMHPLAWYGIIPKMCFDRFSSSIENINSILSAERLGLLATMGD